MKKVKTVSPQAFLEHLNKTYANIHLRFEKAFWDAAMGDHSVNKKKNQALTQRDAFRNSKDLSEKVNQYYDTSSGVLRERFGYWKRFFSLYQVPEQAVGIKKKIDTLQTKIEQQRARRKEGYLDPKTKKFVAASANTMVSLMVTHSDEKVRKACFDARQQLPLAGIKDYLRLVALRNQYARLLGYEDFYAYKLDIEEGMTKKDLFDLFDTIYEKTKYAYAQIRSLEKEKFPGLRKPWNYSYFLSASFVKEEDPYYPFEETLVRWGRSFAALGIDFKGGKLVLDLLDRKGKYNNGFCHWPMNVYEEKGKRIPGWAQFTCTAVQGIPGQSANALHTLFHEGGHAAHLLNAQMKDICVTTEYPPLSTAWAETQSMFLDTVFSSIEWKLRYAISKEGTVYPFELFERKLKHAPEIRPIGIVSSVAQVCEFERRVYEEKKLTQKKLLSIAKTVYRKYTDMSVDSLRLLEVPHIYSWESACSYHGYGLATLALYQWRDYFYKKYNYIVDNPFVGKEMERVWADGASKTFPEFVKKATGKKLSPTSYLSWVTASNKTLLKKVKERIAVTNKRPLYEKPIVLGASITMVDGKKVIATNRKSFEDMATSYAKWLSRPSLPVKRVARKAKKK